MYRIFGDIENSQKVFDTTIRNLSDTSSTTRIIYLGDMYAHYASSTTIGRIHKILQHHHIQIVNKFNETNIHDIDYVQNIWMTLYNQKHLDIYDKEYIQSMNDSPLDLPPDETPRPRPNSLFGTRVQPPAPSLNKYKRVQPPATPIQKVNIQAGRNRFAMLSDSSDSDDDDTPTHVPAYQPPTHVPAYQPPKPNWNRSLGASNDPQSPVFILGNKEMAFMLQMVHPISLHTTSDHKLVIEYYSSRKRDNRKRCVNEYTFDELNIMYTYMSQIRHHYYCDDILCIHNYDNAKMFMGSAHQGFNFTRIICGHNRGFGQFSDDKYRGKSIYMIDYTGRDDETNIPSKVYIDINDRKVIMYGNRIRTDLARLKPM